MKFIITAFLILLIQSTSGQQIQYGYNDKVGKYFDAGDGTNLYYEIYGAGSPLVLLHGGVFGYIDEFEYLIPKLTDKYQVICLASRGHVKSDIGFEPYTYEQRANDVLALINLLGLKHITVIGFSDGGFTAYKLAAAHPELIDKMVVMGAGDDPPKEKPGTSSYSAENLLNSYGDYFQKRISKMPEPERWDESLSMLNELYNSSFISQETFQSIQCPVLVMSGDRDEFTSPEESLQAHLYLPHSSLSIIPDCDHVILYCNFPAVWESMKVFLGY